MPGITKIEQQVQDVFVKYLFDKWEIEGSLNNIALDGDNPNWESLLGFHPNKFILIDKFSLNEEKVPRQVLQSFGLQPEKIDHFLMALGAQGENAAVVKTRRFFIGAGGSIDTGMSQAQTLATLKWLSINEVLVFRDDISSFYRNLAGKNIELVYFPASIAGSDKLRIVMLSADIFYLTKEELKNATYYSLNLRDFAEAANSPIINLGILQDWGEYLSAKVLPLYIRWDEIDWEQIFEEKRELDFPFYKEWKIRYPHFEIFILTGGEIPNKILVKEVIVKRIRVGKILVSQNKNIVYVGGGNLDQLINLVENSEAFNQNARSFLKQCYQAQLEQFAKFLELAKKDSEFAQLLTQHAQAINLKEARKELAEELKEEKQKYTLKWFLNLLELVRVQEKSLTIPELIFFKCNRVPSAEKTYELSESSSTIPFNIESFDEIPTVITYLNEKDESLTLNTNLIASEKYQKLWVMFPEAVVQPILKDPTKIIQVKLSFTRHVDLIDSLKSGFRNLELQDETNLKATLSPEIDFIFGPPGTGKTTELATQILRRVSEGRTGPIIVLTPTNKAADVLAKKIIGLNNNIAPKWLIRAGSCTDPYLLREKVVKFGTELLIEEKSNSVLLTTIHRFSYFLVPISPITLEKAKLCDCPWSEVIFDEASMIPIAYITYAVQTRQKANNKTRFLIAGDPLQIPPVFDLLAEDLQDYAEELQEENIYKMIGLMSFDTTIQKKIPIYGNRIQNLDVQYRSIPAIGELFSKFQYGGKIKHARGTTLSDKSGISEPLPQRLRDIGLKPITIIRYPVKAGDSIFKPKKLNGSPIHLYSALLVSELVKVLRKEVKRNNEAPLSM